MTFPFPMFSYAAAGGGAWTDYNGTNDKTPVQITAFDATGFHNIIPLTSTTFAHIYRGQSSNCRVSFGTVDVDGVTTYSSETVLVSGTMVDIKADLLDSTHIVVAIETGGDTKAFVFSFSGTTVSVIGTPVSFETLNSQWMSVAALTSSAFLIGYEDISNTDGKVYYGTVSGTTVTAKSGITFTTNNMLGMGMVGLTSTTAIIISAESECESYLVSVVADTPQVDDNLTLSAVSGSIRAAGVVKLSSTEVIATFTDRVAPTAQAVLITESSGSLSKGDNETFASVDMETSSVTLPNDNQAVVSYGVNNVGISNAVLEISGNSLTATSNSPVASVTGDKEFTTNGALSDDFVVVGYEDDNDSSRAKSIVLRP